MIILGFDEAEIIPEKALFINKILSEKNTGLRLETFEGLKAQQFPVKPRKLNEDPLFRNPTFRAYRNATDLNMIKRKNEVLNSDLEFCLNDDENFNQFLRRERQANKTNNNNNNDKQFDFDKIQNISQVLDVFNTAKLKNSKRKNENSKNNFNPTEHFNNQAARSDFNAYTGRNKKAYKDYNYDYDCDFHSKENYKDDSISNIGDANFLRGKNFFNNEINFNNFFNFNKNKNGFLSEEKDSFSAAVPDNFTADANSNLNFNHKNSSLDKNLFGNKSVPEARKENKPSTKEEEKEKEVLTNNLSSEATDINRIKIETSSMSVVSVKSKTKNEFATVKLGNEIIQVASLPEKRQLRDRSKNKSNSNNKNNFNPKDQDARSVNSFVSQPNLKRIGGNYTNNKFKAFSSNDSIFDNKSFNSYNNHNNNYNSFASYRSNKGNRNNENNFPENYFYDNDNINNNNISDYYAESASRNTQSHSEIEARIKKLIEQNKTEYLTKLNKIKEDFSKQLKKKEENSKKLMKTFATKLFAYMENNYEKKKKFSKTEKKEKAINNNNSQNAKSNAEEPHDSNKKKRGQKPKKAKISQLEKEELNLKINDVKTSLYFIRGFKKLFNTKGEQEYNFNLYEVKDDKFIELKALVEETIVKLNAEDDANKKNNFVGSFNNIRSSSNNVNENFDARSVLSNNLIINNNLNPLIKNILDDSVSGSSLSSSSDSEKSLGDVKNFSIKKKEQEQFLSDLISNIGNKENQEEEEDNEFKKLFKSPSFQEYSMDDLNNEILTSPTFNNNNKNLFEQLNSKKENDVLDRINSNEYEDEVYFNSVMDKANDN